MFRKGYPVKRRYCSSRHLPKFDLDNGHLHFQNHEFDKAIACYSNALTKYDNKYLNLAYYSRGITHFCLGNIEQALTDLTNAIDGATPTLFWNQDPHTSIPIDHALFVRGKIHQRKLNHQKAIDDFTLAMKQEGKFFIPTCFKRGLSFFEIKRFDKAVIDLAKVLQSEQIPYINYSIVYKMLIASLTHIEADFSQLDKDILYKAMIALHHYELRTNQENSEAIPLLRSCLQKDSSPLARRLWKPKYSNCSSEIKGSTLDKICIYLEENDMEFMRPIINQPTTWSLFSSDDKKPEVELRDVTECRLK